METLRSLVLFAIDILEKNVIVCFIERISCFLRKYAHQWRVFSVVVFILRNFPRNSLVLRAFLPIKFDFNYLELYSIRCQFLANNLHFITYSGCTGQSPDGQQPNKEATL